VLPEGESLAACHTYAADTNFTVTSSAAGFSLKSTGGNFRRIAPLEGTGGDSWELKTVFSVTRRRRGPVSLYAPTGGRHGDDLKSK